MAMGVEELAAPLGVLPPVDFCCAYGSSLLPNNTDKAAMVDYILGVSDPVQWHSENLERNRGHYASWMACLGPKTITCVAEMIGVGVHFNPFVPWKDKVLSQWPFAKTCMLAHEVFVLVDNFDIRMVNAVNLKAAVAAGLLLSPPEFAEEDLYSTICSLSYMGDLRMLFAEDKHKVRKIVKGSFSSFQAMYRPFIREYSMEGLLESSCHDQRRSFKQECGISATKFLFDSLPCVQNQRRTWMGSNAGGMAHHVAIASREEAVNYTRRALRRLVMVSSAKQMMSGLLAAGGVNAVRYLGNKMSKAWKSRVTCP